jgi:hypothetical protein
MFYQVTLIIFYLIYVQSTTLSVATWNLKLFSRLSRTDEEISLIALVAARYDLLALQEIRTNDEAIIALIDILEKSFGLKYNYLVSEGVSKFECARARATRYTLFTMSFIQIGYGGERYAFIWRSDRIKLRNPPSPRLFPDPNKDFERDPYCATFETLDTLSSDLALCNQHAIFGTNRAEREAEAKRLRDVVLWWHE